jgi:hypothetical protein
LLAFDPLLFDLFDFLLFFCGVGLFDLFSKPLTTDEFELFSLALSDTCDESVGFFPLKNFGGPK